MGLNRMERALILTRIESDSKIDKYGPLIDGIQKLINLLGETSLTHPLSDMIPEHFEANLKDMIDNENRIKQNLEALEC